MTDNPITVVISQALDRSLKAWVDQDGHKGDNLLRGKRITSVETAKITVERALRHANYTGRIVYREERESIWNPGGKKQ